MNSINLNVQVSECEAMMRIYELQKNLLIYSEILEPAEHSHMAAHVIISLKDKIKVVADGNTYCCKGIMIPSGVLHRIETYGNPVLTFLYDSTTNIAKCIKKVLILDDEECVNIISLFNSFELSNNKVDYFKMETHILGYFGLCTLNVSVIDDRILDAMKFIRENVNSSITCKTAADSVFLSESRFSHLFKDQVGMTFSAYVISQRIFKVYADVMQGKTVTEAAIEAGFSSSAHFADVNKRVFGVSIRNISRDLTYIKVK